MSEKIDYNATFNEQFDVIEAEYSDVEAEQDDTDETGALDIKDEELVFIEHGQINTERKEPLNTNQQRPIFYDNSSDDDFNNNLDEVSMSILEACVEKGQSQSSNPVRPDVKQDRTRIKTALIQQEKEQIIAPRQKAIESHKIVKMHDD